MNLSASTTAIAILLGSIVSMSIATSEIDSASTPFPTSASVPVPAPTCTGSTPGWVDVDGDGCDWYESYEPPGCPYFGDYAGADANTGEMIAGAPGTVANDNCCHCFGTAAPAPPIQFPTFSPTTSSAPTAPTPKPTSPCTGNTPDWTDSFGDGCEWYEMFDEPGCPNQGHLYDGGMGLPKDNCCYCKMMMG